MKTMSQGLSYLLPVLYLMVIYVYYTIFSGRNKRLGKRTTPFLILLVLLHMAEIASRHILIQAMPYSTSHDAFSFLAFSILLIYMVIELSLRNHASGIFILCFAFIPALISTINVTWEPETSPLLTNQTFVIHASLSIIGYTALSLSAIYSLMYIIQNRNLKKHHLGRLYLQLPPLHYLEKMSMGSVFIGILVLGIGILLGHFQADKLLGAFWPHDVKVLVTDVIWLSYLFAFLSALMLKWRGKWIAYLSLSGFLILISAGLLVIYLTQSFHNFSQ
ncbi:MAG: cytochrome c biogenesis protein CcsA [Candidatus Latescibacterota bacterium]